LIGGQVRAAGEPTGASIVAAVGADPFGFKLDANNITLKNFTIQKETIQAIQTVGTFAGFKVLHNKFIDNVVAIVLENSSLATATATTISGNTCTNGLIGPTPQNGILSHGGLS